MDPKKNNLTRDEARERADLIRSPLYDVTLDLTQGEEHFGCDATINFLCEQPNQATFIDFYAESIDSMELNGEELPKKNFDGTRITLNNLKEANELHVKGTCSYSHIGSGLSLFKDPVDQKVYLHSQFETFDAHWVYPCFDQPDLKATFTFTVFAPTDWQVISNTVGKREDVAGKKEIARWTFATTPKMPTYITAIVAGPYNVFRDRHNGIELGLYCRQSLAQYLPEPETREIFEITKQGLDFFGKTYAYPYPFGNKYDQLFVPEFSAGAMENAACVTFSEYFIFRSKVTDAARETRAEVILHEMAHMWFGDLVTMRWWDDLWLNESFATFMSTFAQQEATRFKNAWVTFANQVKAGARRQDQLPTSHPIAAKVEDIESVYLNFDQITYEKGASVIRQLVAWVGQDTFVKGVQNYLKHRQFGNASLKDFLHDVGEGSGRDLTEWSRQWLETAGLNTLDTLTTTSSDPEIYETFTIQQEAPAEFPTLRPHRMSVGLYDLKDGELKLRNRVELDVTGASTPVAELVEEEVPDLLLLNDTDLAYVKVRLDKRSLATARDHLAGLRDPLARSVAWSALWDMVRDAKLAARQFVPLVLNNIQGETDIGVVQDLLARVGSAIEVYGEPENAKVLSQVVADHALDALRKAQPGSDLQLVWARSFITSADRPEHLAIVRGLLDGSVTYPGLKVDTDLRWTIVTSVASKDPNSERLIASELERDPTDMGQRHAARARAIRPSSDAKADAWKAVTKDKDLPLAMLRSIMAGFQQFDQVELEKPYVDRYFDNLDPIWKSREIEVALAYAKMLYPSVVIGDDLLKKTGDYLARDSIPGPIRRILLESRDAMERAMRGRMVDAASAAFATV